METGRIRDFVQAVTSNERALIVKWDGLQLSAQCNSCVEGIGASLRTVEFWIDLNSPAVISKAMQAISNESLHTETLKVSEILNECEWPESILGRRCLEKFDRQLSLLTNVALSIDGFDLIRMKSQMASNSFLGFKIAIEHYFQIVMSKYPNTIPDTPHVQR